MADNSNALFQGWLQSDPLYQQALAQINAAAGSDKSALQQAVNQLMIQYGITPDLQHAAGQLGLGGGALAHLLSMVDPATAKAAAENTAQGTSVLGALGRAYQTQLAGIKGNLAARGMLDSGENAFQMGQSGLKYNQGVYNSLSRMLGNYDTDQQRLATQLDQLYGAGGQLNKAMDDAWTRFQAAVRSGQVTPPSTGGGTGVTPPPKAV